jgi:hypothetical protein
VSRSDDENTTRWGTQLRVVVFHQNSADANSLGRWRLLQDINIHQLVHILGLGIGYRRGPDIVIHGVAGDHDHGIALPQQHEPSWGSSSTLDGERELTEPEAEARLLGGRAIQVFVFNNVSDCVRHFLVLPLAAHVFGERL